MRDPYTDLEINCRSQLTILEACRYNNPGVKVVFAGTRQVYGRPDSLPVTETHLVRPTDVNGINKAAGEYYHLVYNNVFGVRACSLRLTNVYGPRQLIRHNRQGFIGWFIRLAIEDRTIQIYGDGSQLRDFVYVDDAADAFLRAGASDACNGEVFNVGGDEPISHRELATLLVEVAGIGPRRVRRLAAGEEGDRHRRASTPTRRSSSGATGWAPDGRRCATGCDATVAFYRAALRPATSTRPVARRGARVTRAARSRSCRSRPREDAAAVRAAIDRVHRERLVRARARGRGVRSRVRRARSGAAHAVGVGTGTDAIALILRALGIGAGDEVITTPLSAAYTALAIMMAGARPVFADVDPERLTLDPDAVAARDRRRARARSCRCTCTDRPADMAAIERVAVASRPRDRRGLLPGASRDSGRAAGRHDRRRRRVQLLPDEEPRRARRRRRRRHQRSPRWPSAIKRLRNGGQTDRYHHQDAGVNSRLDEMQAAILRARLPFLAGVDRHGAARWPRGIARAARGTRRSRVPPECDAGHVYHLFVVRVGAARPTTRRRCRRTCAARGIETLIHYPVPIPRQPALAASDPADCPVAARGVRRGAVAAALSGA